MLDARNIHRKVTRAIFDFSPEQQKNIAAIVWLYRGQTERFFELVEAYLSQAVAEGQATDEPLETFEEALGALIVIAWKIDPIGGNRRPKLTPLGLCP